jgi:hypothetical protein
MPNTIQPREYSRGGGTDGALCNSDGDLNLLGANRNDDGYNLNAVVTMPRLFYMPMTSSHANPGRPKWP